MTIKSMHEKPKKPRKLKIKIDSPFRSWIESLGGTTKAAARIGVSDRAIRGWLSGEYSPTIKQCERLVKLSRGEISVQDILEHTNALKRAQGQQLKG